ALVRNLPAFLRFLPVAGLFHGQVLNISGLARDAATSRTTIEGYIGILEDTLLAARVPAFESRLRARERRHPKLYWVDPGLVRPRSASSAISPPKNGARCSRGWCSRCCVRTTTPALCSRRSRTGRHRNPRRPRSTSCFGRAVST